jgi:DNA-binding transcriptional MerR regulator
MTRIPTKLFKVGEIMRHTGLSRQTIHNYTMLGLIKYVERLESGHRLYPEEVFHRIDRIKMLSRHRTLAEIKEIFEAEEKDGPAKSAASADDSKKASGRRKS